MSSSIKESKSMESASPDLEKHALEGHSVDDKIETLNVLDPDAPPSALDRTSFWGRSLALSAALERKVGIEARGIQRVPEDQRPDRPSGNLWIWLAANCVLTTFGIGILGPSLFFLGLGDSMLTIFFTNVATCVLPAYMATFGPKLGLRQMTSARFSWGWHGAKVVALLNCVACVGWSAITTIAAAQTLRVVANDTISDAAGVVIVAIITLALCMLGYKYVHIYEKWSWIPTAITFFILLGCAAKEFVNVPMGIGQAEASNVLSFMGVIFGFVAGWVSFASDYNVYQPAETPAWKTFAWTYAGLIFPLVLIQWLGAAVMCVAGGVAPSNDAWTAAFAADELGGLLGAVLIPVVGNFGKFCMVLLVLSVVANNIINVYSMGLSISVIHVWLAKVPRLIWPIVITAIYIPIAIAGANSFSTSLEDFMNVLGYWLSIFVVVVLLEHFIFRKGDFACYQAAETWNRQDRTPVGIAALVAFLFGALGTAMGMAQVWYIGKIGALVGGAVNPYGGDIGFELAGAFAGIVYVPARYLEIKFIGR
ncbi:permease for cytosine/purines, uracil, thiamine, allantoin-domain-containing protein [Mycena metata]|uniref:Permease for cytosine/purines, uracil, thiamine, allantoin-domain-containing protein n=1 Tax=Mycena metata TaxID=1033252 RepID=A0AAD7IM06_9AGAR|nr:permease for cytosine/purines, uracil, thiamine, allantoin-domain-containing protein [Mycena metata]